MIVAGKSYAKREPVDVAIGGQLNTATHTFAKHRKFAVGMKERVACLLCNYTCTSPWTLFAHDKFAAFPCEQAIRNVSQHAPRKRTTHALSHMSVCGNRKVDDAARY